MYKKLQLVITTVCISLYAHWTGFVCVFDEYLNNKQVKVCYSDDSAIQILAIQIPTALDNFSFGYGWESDIHCITHSQTTVSCYIYNR